MYSSEKLVGAQQGLVQGRRQSKHLERCDEKQKLKKLATANRAVIKRRYLNGYTVYGTVPLRDFDFSYDVN